ncbi:BMP family lipoprotein [Pontivivens nitratireducens]|uniref:BMP family ABC transporter substrate-binding protein n=1 Tax=Pontivivens nitratireducens TaxID=2758038 RepID=A0A6G7VK07_9RHOB|nr:BMP family ABC transporter substrate-binding protein [Pontibrevibacter nitratireducens]QIK40334.1 BMP family ABC transporter substrate-binding protein [Pontibrevibacter nitratireducens]
MKKTLIGAVVASLVATSAYAESHAEIMPAVVYDMGGKFDQSFNQAAYIGAERFMEETGIEYRDFEIQNDAQREQALRRFAQQGHNPIIAIGFSHGAAVDKVAAEFPDTDFAIVDMVVEQPNVRSIVFKEQEGSYLAGVAAAMASDSQAVGFVGGMDIPLIRKFECGFLGGARSVNPDIEFIGNMTGTDGSAWNNPTRGDELARSQFARGVDVVYHAAGGTGIGVLQAAADEGLLGIGVDSNQNAMHPGSVLTSMLKRVDNAVYDTFEDSMNGEFTYGFDVNGLAEEGVGLALDEHNEELMTPEILEAVDLARQQIIDGEVEVHDYTSDSACPY